MRRPEKQDSGDRPRPVEVPYRDLPADTLRAVVEAFVLREGTEYGARDVTLEVKVSQVMRQLERGEAAIFYDPATETVNIIVAGSQRG